MSRTPTVGIPYWLCSRLWQGHGCRRVDGTGNGGMGGHPAMWLERFQHASLLLTAGASPMTAQRQFRQSDPLTVLRNYAHIIGTEQRQAAERVADILRPTSATFENQLVAVQ